jgi:hypothetical protein
MQELWAIPQHNYWTVVSQPVEQMSDGQAATSAGTGQRVHAIKHVPSGTVLTLPPEIPQNSEITNGHLFGKAKVGIGVIQTDVGSVWKHRINEGVAGNIKAPLFLQSSLTVREASSPSDRTAACLS